MNFARDVDVAARTAPDRTAVADRKRALTYEELRAETNAFANAVESLGIEEFDRVAIYADNSVTFVAAYFAIMKRGAVPFPVNMRFSERELAHVLDDAGTVAVVTSAAYAADIEGIGVESVDWLIVDGESPHGESYKELVAESSDQYYPQSRRRDDPADILYTSGTTGLPKGVRHTHGNVRANVDAFVRYRHHHQREVSLTITPCFHVSGLYITVLPSVVAAAENRIHDGWDPIQALETIDRRGVSYTFFVPTMIVDLLNVDDRERFDTGTLDVVGTGGAPIARDRLIEFEEAFDCTVVDGYGMTEVTCVATTTPLDRPRKVGSPGRPAWMDIADIAVVDPTSDERCQRGKSGEIQIAGDSVTPGYLNRPQKNEESFVSRDGERWFRTGDSGRIDDDGYLFVEGRLDGMIITGGENVHPSAVEETLHSIAGVADVAVTGTSHERLGEAVTAFVVRDRENVTAESIREASRQRLAEYKIPRRIEFVSALPRSSTQKVDKQALRERLESTDEPTGS
jgi:acyl-CoA synthetase (AMP-forming)/AMP-acid ligase II